MILSSLPIGHPLRSLPLREISAECRNLQSAIWRSVSHWRIGRNSFNELRGPWLEFNEFRSEAAK